MREGSIGASTWSHPSARDATKCCPWARLDLGWGLMRGGHSEVAGGKTKVLMRDPGSRLLPSPCEGRGCSRKRFSLGVGGRSPRVRLLPRKSISAPWTPIMACEPRFVLGLGGKGWMHMAFGRGVSPRGLGGETAPPFLGEREGQGAGFPEIWGVPPLLKPPSPATPPLSWNPVPRGGGEGERSFRECREEGRTGSPEAWVPAGGGGVEWEGVQGSGQ